MYCLLGLNCVTFNILIALVQARNLTCYCMVVRERERGDKEKLDLTYNRSVPLSEVGEVRWGIMFVSERPPPKTR